MTQKLLSGNLISLIGRKILTVNAVWAPQYSRAQKIWKRQKSKYPKGTSKTNRLTAIPNEGADGQKEENPTHGQDRNPGAQKKKENGSGDNSGQGRERKNKTAIPQRGSSAI